MTRTTWADWRAAEERLARGEDLDSVASELEEKPAWILRALAAVEAGDRPALEALGERAPDRSLWAVAEIALSDLGQVDPTRFRAFLKRAGVGNEPLPRLDLLRLACVAHNRERPTRPQKLARAAYDRPVLEAALMVLSPKFKPYKIEEPVLERSPRLASFWAAGIAQLLTNGNVREYVRTHVEGVEPLPNEGWPDLDAPIAEAPGDSRSTLEDFLRDPLERPWSAVCTAHAKVLVTRGDRALRLTALGRLLDAIGTVIRESAPPAALPAVEAAVELARASHEVRERETLLEQLDQLRIRLQWSSSELPASCVEALWSGFRPSTPAERVHAARAILERVRDGTVPQTVAPELLAAALEGGVDWKSEGSAWLTTHGAGLDVRAFQRALGDAPDRVREPALGFWHALHGSMVEALAMAQRMIGRGALEDAELITLAALGHGVLRPARGRQERRRRHKALIGLAGTAAASATPPSAHFLAQVLNAAHASFRLTEVAEVLEALHPAIANRLASEPEPDHADLLSRLQLWTMLGCDDEAQQAFREFGRFLRKSRPEEAITAALRLCAGLCPDEDVIDGYGLDGDGPPASPDGDPRPAWLHSLTSFLDRHDPELVAQRAMAIVHEDSVDEQGLALWFVRVSELEETSTWSEVLSIGMASAVPSLFEILDRMTAEFE